MTSMRLTSSSLAMEAIERPNASIFDVVIFSVPSSMVTPSMISFCRRAAPSSRATLVVICPQDRPSSVNVSAVREC